MSVTQISRIQHRRGKKNTDFGFPQLASGELGWAIDTQELYIGNGAVSEGAPYVGNTKILTEHEDILQFVSAYQYQINNPTIETGEYCSEPIKRSLQERLDDLVSVRAFGVIGDGRTDNTVALQRAIDQLFLNDATKNNSSSRVVLYLEPGEYIITGELKIPPFAHIVGSGIDSTIIHQTNNAAIFRTVDSNSTPGNYSAFGSHQYTNTRARYILLSNMTLSMDTISPIFYLDNADSCSIDKIRFVGSYQNVAQYNLIATTPNYSQNAVYIRGTSSAFCSTNTVFSSCIFNGTGNGVYSDTDSNNIAFDNCVFYGLFDAINIGGGNDGSVNTKVTNCFFDQIVRYGLRIKKGYGNTSSNNKFMLVGNDNNNYGNPTYPIILFDTDYNQSLNDYFERDRKLKDQDLFGTKPFVPSVQTPGLVYDNTNFRKSFISTGLTPTAFMRFPLFNSCKIVIDYTMDNHSSIRTGVMTITVFLDIDDGSNGPAYTNHSRYNFVDNFDYNGGPDIEKITFSVDLRNFTLAPGITTPDTLVVSILNNGNGTGTVNYTYKILSI